MAVLKLFICNCIFQAKTLNLNNIRVADGQNGCCTIVGVSDQPYDEADDLQVTFEV